VRFNSNQQGPPAWAFVLLAFAAVPLRDVSPATALWAIPCLLLSAILIAWAAESAQFFIAQGFALAILAWLQTLPEFAVEAVLAWKQQVPFLLANLTGALRMLTGLGWPMIYFAAAFAHRRKTRTPLRRIQLEADHCVEVVGLLVPLIYISVVLAKGSLNLIDAAVLIIIYGAYLTILGKMPPREHEGIEELEYVPRTIVLSPRGRRIFLIMLFFAAGGVLIYFTAEPFLASLMAIAIRIGIPSFVFIQWVAPFVSEFPEMASTFYWARTVTRAPMALMNMVSSNINQWTLLVAMLPIVYSASRGGFSSIPFDDQQKLELLLTLAQAVVAMLFLMNMELTWWEATVLFALWLVQFVFSAFSGPIAGQVRWAVTIAYFAWAAWEVLRIFAGKRKPVAFTEFARVWRERVRMKAA
jgi:cation:H+ antiporter